MIVRPSELIDIDKRFKSWAKKIKSPNDLKLDLKNGYSIAGEWVKVNESITLNEEEFLVVAAENGSMRHHHYNYILLQGNGIIHCDTQKKAVSDEYRNFKVESDFNEEIVAKSENSTLYKFACFMCKFYNSNTKIDFTQLKNEKSKLLDRIAEIDAIIKKMEEKNDYH